MNTIAKFSRCTAAVALVLAGAGAGAQTVEAANLVWVENESFGFEACHSGDAPALLAASRAQAGAMLAQSLRSRGVGVGERQFVTLTPLAGEQRCDTLESRVSYRVVAVDRDAGRSTSGEIVVASTLQSAVQTSVARAGEPLRTAGL